MAGELDNIRTMLIDVQRQLAVAAERESTHRETMARMQRSIDSLGEEIVEIKNMANRWKGGFLVLAALGGIIGWILSTWSSLSGLVKG